ncbi:helix-turn-helix domain-containing protein [Promicromonospora kroppenstedtii]|uniref:Helix-turn-helix domain-containing protein n=1 Tax=Promicromonospora kroppenstedtii TaxID=440482 RepID=A0ABW7XMN8_9MICO
MTEPSTQHDLLAQLRRRAGLTQEELAERAGLAVRSVSNIERSAVEKPRVSTLRAIGAGLGLDDARVGELLDFYRRRWADRAADGTRNGPARPVTPAPLTWAAPTTPATGVPGTSSPAGEAPAQLPAPPSTFSGRAAELAELDDVLTSPDGGHRCTVLDGAAGVGKTALVLAWAHARRGAFPDGQLYAELRGSAHGQPPTADDVASRFLTDLGIPDAAVPSSAVARTALLRHVLAARRMLVVLDDVASAAQVRPLLPGPGACTTVVASRHQLRGLSIRDGARHVGVHPLPDDDAARLVRTLLGDERLRVAPRAVDAMVHRCCGLPLALRIACDHLTRRTTAQAPEALAAWLAEPAPLDAFRTADDTECDLRAAFTASYRQVPDEAARYFRLLGVPPRTPLSRDAVAALWDLPLQTSDRLMAELVAAHLIEEPAPGRYELHGLLWEFARETGVDQDPEPIRRAALRGILEHWATRAARG